MTYDAITEHFSYGSIGSEPGVSLLRAGRRRASAAVGLHGAAVDLPREAARRVTRRSASSFERGHDAARWRSSRRRRLGIDHVGLNCAVCHTGTVRDTPDVDRRASSSACRRISSTCRRFVEFVLECTLDNRTTPESVAGRLQAKRRVGIALRAGIAAIRAHRSPEDPDAGAAQPHRAHPGPSACRAGAADAWIRSIRIRPFSSTGSSIELPHERADRRVRLSVALEPDGRAKGMHLHWDGDNDSVDERNLSAALGAGVTPVTVDHASIKRVRDWIWTLPPPRYPYPIDTALARRRAQRSISTASNCHADHRFRDGVRAPGATRVGLVEDIDRIGTDRHRLDSYTDVFAANQVRALSRVGLPLHALPQDARLRQPSARRHLGCARRTLHNGSVPTLLDLLNAPAGTAEGLLSRIRRVRSRERVGFVSNVPEERGRLFFPA